MENNSQNTRALKETGPENLSIPKLTAVAVFLYDMLIFLPVITGHIKRLHYQNFEPIYFH